MRLGEFYQGIRARYGRSLFRVGDVKEWEAHAKEYLYRLRRRGAVERIDWGWYHLPEEPQDIWDFLAQDKHPKVVIKQTAARFWNQDFVHRNIYHVAVEDPSYKRALESYLDRQGWQAEIELSELDRIPSESVDGLPVQKAESCLVDCIAEWSFTDALAVLFFHKTDIALPEIKEYGRWRRIAHSEVRVWQAVRYACTSFNRYAQQEIFPVRRTELSDELIKNLMDEAVEKVMEFA